MRASDGRCRRSGVDRRRRGLVAADVLHHVVSVVHFDHLVCFDGPLQVAQRVPHDHARRPPLHEPRHRHGQVDPQRVVDVGAVGRRRERVATVERAEQVALHQRPRERTRRVGEVVVEHVAHATPEPGHVVLDARAAPVRRRGRAPSPASRRWSTPDRPRTRSRRAKHRAGDAVTSICSCASSVISCCARSGATARRGDGTRREHAVARRPHAGQADRQHRHQHAERVPRRGAHRDGEAHQEQPEELVPDRLRRRPLEEEEVGDGDVVAAGAPGERRARTRRRTRRPTRGRAAAPRRWRRRAGRRRPRRRGSRSPRRARWRPSRTR